ncbi:MAG: CTP synthase (glutamine hydrolyzing) [Candidatus Woesearchaeota archaeon]
MQDTKWIIVTGGIMSGLGKGTTAASIGRLIKSDKKIIAIKCDGYLNVDPGTINPTEHGEVFVLCDGGEVDMDFGHYERFLDIDCKFEWNLTSGKIFNAVIEKERKGDYLGRTIQIFPHIIDEIKYRLKKIAKDEKADIVIIEIGGTVGDIENSWFIEAVKQLRKEVGKENILYTHVTYIPFLDSVEELKTKPSQRDIALLRERGIYPDIIIGRCRLPLDKRIKEKLALFSDVEPDMIISGQNIESVYEIPIMFEKEGIIPIIKSKLKIDYDTDISEWKELVKKIKNPKKEITIAIGGKYTYLKDSYASIIEALIHSGAHNDCRVKIKWIETTDIEQGKISCRDALKDVQGLIIPGGFGSRGIEGKIRLIHFVRENKIPFLGICYGLQLAVVEFARNICNLKNANTTESNENSEDPVVCILPEQKDVTKKGGTMRLGGYTAELKKGTIIQRLYGSEKAYERHRHRYEVNPDYHEILVKNGLIFSGTSMNGRLVEYIELNQKEHPYFIATQAHPELTSRLERPNPLFLGLVKVSINQKENK